MFNSTTTTRIMQAFPSIYLKPLSTLKVTGMDSAVHGNRHSPGRGGTPVVTMSSTAEEECPVRETYWTGGSSVAVREARAENRYFKEG